MSEWDNETVTVTFLANFEVDPDQFDLRLRDPDKIREELMDSVCSSGSPQQCASNTDDAMERYLEKIREAREESQ